MSRWHSWVWQLLRCRPILGAQPATFLLLRPPRGLILQDLTFVHLGNPDYIDGKVNFSKRWQQFNILDSMRCFQQAHYDIRRNDDIINFFNDFSDHLAEEALWELSLKIKPRNITRRKTDREEKT